MDWLLLLREFGLPLATMVIIGWAGWKEVWKWGADYREMKAQRDKLQTQIDRLLELAFKNAALAERQAGAIREGRKEKDDGAA